MQTRAQKSILIVDDDSQIRKALSEAIRRMGFTVDACDGGEPALEKLRHAEYAMVVTDMNMPTMSGLAFLKEIRRRIGNLPVLVITGFGTVENAVESMKEGATDYLMKPFSYDSLKKSIESMMMRTSGDREIVTASPAMKRLVALAENLAANDITVLILGESGTGKELLARQIQKTSRRKDQPFVPVNCAAIPDTLLESELFGHEKGAFTGALDRKKGKFELANHGTILLDEIGELPLLLQAKLLRVLQEREIDRVGGREPIPVDVRIIATTNRNLARECSEGKFREDLFYRLNVFPLKVPPLRERQEDILALADRFIAQFSSAAGKTITGYTDEAADFLKTHPWRGNVRELENVIQRAVFMCSTDRITLYDLMLDIQDEQNQAVNGKIKDMEKELILRTLKEVNGNKARAAHILGVSVRTIRNKLNEYGKNFPDGEKTASWQDAHA
ncbi:MAG: sigma-54 dependent transcriptional regulator [Nitrospirota bacterium]